MAQDATRRVTTTPPLPGGTLVARVNAIVSALEGGNKGATAPASPAVGLIWVDDSAGATWTVKQYDGADWITLYTVDTTANTAAFSTSLPLGGFISGFVPSNNGTDAVNDLDFTAGVAWDDVGGDPIQLSAQIRALDAVFAEGGPGYRASADNLTGAKTFHVFAIAGPGKADDLFASTSLSPALPTGFTRKKRVFSFRWDGSLITPFSAMQLAGGALQVLWNDPSSGGWDYSVANPGLVAVLRAVSVPTGIKVDAIMSLWHQDITPAISSQVYTSSPDVADASPTSGSAETFISGSSTGVHNRQVNKLVRTNTSAQVRTRVAGNSDTDITISGGANGWVDPRI